LGAGLHTRKDSKMVGRTVGASNRLEILIKKGKARKMNIKQKIKHLHCKCFGHKPIVEVYAMRVHGKKHKKFHVVRETTCLRCGETIKFEMTDLKSRAELLQEGWFVEE